jgi:hypothetical protein
VDLVRIEQISLLLFYAIEQEKGPSNKKRAGLLTVKDLRVGIMSKNLASENLASHPGSALETNRDEAALRG